MLVFDDDSWFPVTDDEILKFMTRERVSWMELILAFADYVVRLKGRIESDREEEVSWKRDCAMLHEEKALMEKALKQLEDIIKRQDLMSSVVELNRRNLSLRMEAAGIQKEKQRS